MALPLPNLDDRRWADLVEDGRALIPLYSPEWTDHNIHDPGITLMELFAWITEMDLYRVNRIPDAHRRKFLALVNVIPHPPKGARVALGFNTNVSTAVYLPASTEFETDDPQGITTGFRLIDELSVNPIQLAAVQHYNGREFVDFTARLHRGEAIYPLGEDPDLRSALYLGLDIATTATTLAPLRFHADVAGSSEAEHQRLLQNLLQRQAAKRLACQPPREAWTCEETHPSAPGSMDALQLGLPAHHSVRLLWEVYLGNGQWYSLAPEQVVDNTRAFTLKGRLTLMLPTRPVAARFGQVETELGYLRCRLAAGQYDAAPTLQSLLINAVNAEQAVPATAINWVIAPGAHIVGDNPSPGEQARFAVSFDSQQRISSLDFSAANAPEFRVLGYQAATMGTPGQLVIEAQAIGLGNGKPHQIFSLAQAAVADNSLQLVSLEANGWQVWEQQADFDNSNPADAHYTLAPYTLAPEAAQVSFGDGAQGRVVPVGVVLIARYDTTRGEAGNLSQIKGWRLSDNSHNRALLPDFNTVRSALGHIHNAMQPSGGADADSLDKTTARAFERVNRVSRAVTLADYEKLARETPGVQVARVAARANLHADFPCLQATGIVTLTVLPYLPQQKPLPSRQLRQAVAAYLGERRVIGSRIMVVGPTYVNVTVRVDVQACARIDPQRLKQRLHDALDNFFHPLSGGANHDGWPFGRDVYRTEVMQVIDETPGADYVSSLELISDSGTSCGNLCLPPNGLVASGSHKINVLRAVS